ncbi:MAG: hypothetical protein KGH96_05315 [Sphingomonadales bacterium]|nr:hypothetical protein [Sphingomonadales bacterium]
MFVPEKKDCKIPSPTRKPIIGWGGDIILVETSGLASQHIQAIAAPPHHANLSYS